MRCEELSERMPLVAAGAEWTSAESAHLAGCSACAEEWLVVQAGRRLGDRAPRLDANVVAAGVLARLRTEPSPRPAPAGTRTGRFRSRSARWIGGGLAAAAALVLAIGLGRDKGTGNREGPVPQTEMTLTELEGLTSAELEEIMAQLEIDDIGSTAEPGLADLTTEELERLLRSWEG